MAYKKRIAINFKIGDEVILNPDFYNERYDKFYGAVGTITRMGTTIGGDEGYIIKWHDIKKENYYVYWDEALLFYKHNNKAYKHLLK